MFNQIDELATEQVVSRMEQDAKLWTDLKNMEPVPCKKRRFIQDVAPEQLDMCVNHGGIVKQESDQSPDATQNPDAKQKEIKEMVSMSVAADGKKITTIDGDSVFYNKREFINHEFNCDVRAFRCKFINCTFHGKIQFDYRTSAMNCDIMSEFIIKDSCDINGCWFWGTTQSNSLTNCLIDSCVFADYVILNGTCISTNCIFGKPMMYNEMCKFSDCVYWE